MVNVNHRPKLLNTENVKTSFFQCVVFNHLELKAVLYRAYMPAPVSCVCVLQPNFMYILRNYFLFLSNLTFLQF